MVKFIKVFVLTTAISLLVLFFFWYLNIVNIGERGSYASVLAASQGGTECFVDPVECNPAPSQTAYAQLHWPTISGEDYYVQRAETLNDLTYFGPTWSYVYVGAGNTYKWDGLTSNKTYWWGVWGSVRGYSKAFSFTTPNCAPPNNPPSANNLQVTKGDYCSNPAHFFSWTYSDQDGDNQSQFRFQVDDKSNFADCDDGNPATLCVDQTVSGLNNPSPSPNNQPVIVAVSPGADQIGYNPNWPNPNYYWRARVWDNQGGDSGWIYPPNSTVAPGIPFSTEKHQYPTINFSWAPQNPATNENTQFTDQSIVYGGSTKSSWAWTFQDGNPANSALQNPIVKFLSTGAKSITLRVTDSDGFSCQAQKTVSSQLPLPEWIEIPPF